VPRSLLTTSVARASPSTSSAMIRSGRPIWTAFSSAGSMSGTAEIFLSVIRMRGVQNRLHPIGVGDEVGRDIAAVELHPLVYSFSSRGTALPRRDHAVLADLVHDLGDDVADFRIRGRDRGDGAISSRESIGGLAS